MSLTFHHQHLGAQVMWLPANLAEKATTPRGLRKEFVWCGVLVLGDTDPNERRKKESNKTKRTYKVLSKGTYIELPIRSPDFEVKFFPMYSCTETCDPLWKNAHRNEALTRTPWSEHEGNSQHPPKYPLESLSIVVGWVNQWTNPFEKYDVVKLDHGFPN